MTVDTNRIWLTESRYAELSAELRELLQQRAVSGAADVPDDLPDTTAQRDREQRIRRLQELLSDPVVGETPPDDGLVEPGMEVTVRYDDDDEVETFLLAHDADRARVALACSPDSPLGRALLGARQGDHVTYQLPHGGEAGCTLVRVVPYAT